VGSPPKTSKIFYGFLNAIRNSNINENF